MSKSHPGPRGGGGGGLRLRVVGDITAVDAEEWDSLLDPDDLQATHRFVKACADARVEDATYRYVLVYDREGLAATATLTGMNVGLDLLSAGWTRRAVTWARAVRPGFLRLPLHLCGLPVSFGDSCLRLRRGVEPAQVVALVDGALEDHAAEAGGSLLCFKELSPPEATRLASLAALGYLAVPSLPTYRLPLRWGSLGDYLQAMRAGYRRQVLATLRTRERAGLEVRVVDGLDAECARLHPLYEQVMDRAEVQLERLNRAFFEQLGRALRGQSQVLLVERGGEVLAGAILLRGPHVTTFLLAGVDYARNREHQAYLNLVLAVIEEAIASGAREVRLGQTSDRLKARLGGEAEPRVVFLRHRNAAGHRLLAAARGSLFPERLPPERRVFRT